MKKETVLKSTLLFLTVISVFWGGAFAEAEAQQEKNQVKDTIQNEWKKTESSKLNTESITGEENPVSVNRKRPGKEVSDDGEHGDGQADSAVIPSTGKEMPPDPLDKTTKNSQQMRPSAPAQKMRPSSPEQQMRPSSPVQKMRPSDPKKSLKPRTPVQHTRPAAPSQQIRPSGPEQQIRPSSPVQSLRPASPKQQMRPANPKR